MYMSENSHSPQNPCLKLQKTIITLNENMLGELQMIKVINQRNNQQKKL